MRDIIIKRKQAEIEKTADYKKLYEELKTEHLEMIRGIKNCRAEAVREFAERLKEKASSCVMSQNGQEMPETKSYTINALCIDELEKEMTEKEGADNA